MEHARVSEFEAFWKAYPRKVGKLAAEAEFKKARRRASLQELIDGVERYKRAKPEYADWCHPKTFLSQGRWMDEQDTQSAVKRKVVSCQHDPPCDFARQCKDRAVMEEQAAFVARQLG